MNLLKLYEGKVLATRNRTLSNVDCSLDQPVGFSGAEGIKSQLQISLLLIKKGSDKIKQLHSTAVGSYPHPHLCIY